MLVYKWQAWPEGRYDEPFPDKYHSPGACLENAWWFAVDHGKLELVRGSAAIALDGRRRRTRSTMRVSGGFVAGKPHGCVSRFRDVWARIGPRTAVQHRGLAFRREYGGQRWPWSEEDPR